MCGPGALKNARKADKSAVAATVRLKAEYQEAVAAQTIKRRATKMTYAAIAQKIDTSASYITKIFKGDTNVTIESMVKLARATGGRLEVQIVNAETTTVRWAAPRISGKLEPLKTQPSATIFTFPCVANRDAWKDAA